MPIKLYKIMEEKGAPKLAVSGVAGEKIPEVKTLPGSAEYFRSQSTWYQLMNRNYSEAREKLVKIMEDLGIYDFDESNIPCIVEYEEGRSQAEKDRIRRSYKVLSKIFANLIDRLARYRPESRAYAYDSFRDDLMTNRQLIKPYECDVFRETEPAKKRKNKK